MSLTRIKAPQYRICFRRGLDRLCSLHDVRVGRSAEVGPGSAQVGGYLVTVFHEILPNHHIVCLARQPLGTVIRARVLECQRSGDIQMPPDEHSRIEADRGNGDTDCLTLVHIVSVRSLYCFNFFKACNTKVRL